MTESQFWNLLAKKLANDATADEMVELDRYLKADPLLASTAQQLLKIWQQKSTISQLETDLAFQSHLDKLNDEGIMFPSLEPELEVAGLDKSSSRKSRKLLWLAGVCIAAVGLLIFYRVDKPHSQAVHKSFSGEVSTSFGSRTKVVLPDSSVVWLNSGSKLSYDEQFGISNRNTQLVGEAFFDVKKSSVPFVIHANHMNVKVLGTAFNVKSYPSETTSETSLLRGRVEISLDQRPGEIYVLKPNEKLIVSNEPTLKPQVKAKEQPLVMLKEISLAESDSSIIETSWVDNKLVFQDESFADLAVRMERWFGVTINFAAEAISRERLTGRFTNETVQQALEELQMITPFHFSIKSNSITITK